MGEVYDYCAQCQQDKCRNQTFYPTKMLHQVIISFQIGCKTIHIESLKECIAVIVAEIMTKAATIDGQQRKNQN